MTYDLKTLCAQYAQVDYRERLERVFRDFDRVLVTTSFGTTSVNLLHMLQQVKPGHPVHFIDTTYHFPQTWEYAEKLTNDFGLVVKTVSPDGSLNGLTRQQRAWKSDPDFCCYVNKVRPLQALKQQHEVWISGMVGGVDPNRRSRPMFENHGDIIRFYPFIDMSQEEADTYKLIYELPEHPLEAEGYGSVGCLHCTAKGTGRDGRWAGKTKTECGLHKKSFV